MKREYAAALVVFAALLTACATSTSLTAPVPMAALRDHIAPAGVPLQVDANSRVAVLEYEAWFGPRAVTFQNAEAMPVLQSADMVPVGGGYDSADPHVIAQHVQWMEYMGIDAATMDLTNNVGCIFSTGPVSARFCNPPSERFRQQNRTIRDNTGDLYPAWTSLGTSVKLIPLLGCQTSRDLEKGPDGKTGFEKEIEYFGQLMQRFPGLSVAYLGHPLMLVYVGTPVDLTILSRAQAVLRETGLDTKYTFRIVGGYLDSQPQFWQNPNQTPNGPIEIAPQYRFWSVVDRYKSKFALYPTYSTVPGDEGKAENFTASIATAAQNGWGCPQPVYCAEDALRYGTDGTYQTFDNFIALAGQLHPTFLIVDQFNEFAQPDEGWNAQTSDDIEPTRVPGGWGYSALNAVRSEISVYKMR